METIFITINHLDDFCAENTLRPKMQVSIELYPDNKGVNGCSIKTVHF